jgi:hypothetical protein
MWHKIVAAVAFSSFLGLASISADAATLGGGGSGGGTQGRSLPGGGGVRPGTFGFHGRGFGPGVAGRGFGSRRFDRVFGRGPFVSSIWVGNGWLGGPAFYDNDLCFNWTSSGYRWACGY